MQADPRKKSIVFLEIIPQLVMERHAGGAFMSSPVVIGYNDIPRKQRPMGSAWALGRKLRAGPGVTHRDM